MNNELLHEHEDKGMFEFRNNLVTIPLQGSKLCVRMNENAAVVDNFNVSRREKSKGTSTPGVKRLRQED